MPQPKANRRAHRHWGRRHHASRAIDFSAGADQYDAGRKGRLADRYYRALIRVAGPNLRPGDRVLDVGCGTGRLLAQLERSFGITGIGVDPSAAMVRVARAACPDMEILAGSCGALPVEDASVDGIVACLAYHHFDDRAGFVNEAKRSLGPGGKVYLAEPVIPAVIRAPVNAFLRLARFRERLLSPQGLVEELRGLGLEAGLALKKGAVCVVVASAPSST
ncbi:MAG: methyltransferase domain-containing protein [Micrococcales bacterium]|nr:methyltransferase domain-containing protein [Micrococcales bacterium]